VLIAGVPWLLALLERGAGAVSLSAVDWAVVQKYFVFLAVTVFGGSFISGSVLNQIAVWVRKPSAALTILGASAPMTSQYFLSFIVFMALAAAPFALLRLPSLALFALKTATAGTERAKARLWQDQFQAYGPRMPRLSLVLLLGVTFAPINPIVPPACLLYFLMVSLTEKYNLLYVQRERFQSGGLAWPLAQRQATTSLMVGQATLIFMLVVKGAPWAAAAVAPLIPATLLFRSAARALVDRPFSVLSLRAAVDLDANDAVDAGMLQQLAGGGGGEVGGDGAGGAVAAVAADLYRQPTLQFDEDAHEALLAEAAHIDRELRADAEVRRQVNELNVFGPPGAGGQVRLPPGLGGPGPDSARGNVWARPRIPHKRTGVDIEV
jgi:calcium permeable stress-gated cation channel